MYKTRVTQQEDKTSCGVLLIKIVTSHFFDQNDYSSISSSPANVATYRLQITKLLCIGIEGLEFDESKDAHNDRKRSVEGVIIPSLKKQKIPEVIDLRESPPKKERLTSVRPKRIVNELKTNLVGSFSPARTNWRKAVYATQKMDMEFIKSGDVFLCEGIEPEVRKLTLVANMKKWILIQTDHLMHFDKLNGKQNVKGTSMFEKNRFVLGNY